MEPLKIPPPPPPAPNYILIIRELSNDATKYYKNNLHAEQHSLLAILDVVNDRLKTIETEKSIEQNRFR